MLTIEFLNVFHHHCESHTSTTATNSINTNNRISICLPSLLRFLHVFHHYCDSHTPSIITAIPTRLPLLLQILYIFYYHCNFYTFLSLCGMISSSSSNNSNNNSNNNNNIMKFRNAKYI
jgi:hypothetical protein